MNKPWLPTPLTLVLLFGAVMAETIWVSWTLWVLAASLELVLSMQTTEDPDE